MSESSVGQWQFKVENGAKSYFPISDRRTLRSFLKAWSVPNRSTGCLEWNRAIEKGYGIVRRGKRMFKVHRLSAYAFLGFDLESDLMVCHRCDNRRCIRPEHFFFGVSIDNVRDMISKGRFPKRHGEYGGNSILTEKDVITIRQLRFGGRSIASLAREYGLSMTGMANVCNGRNWKHLL